MSFHIINVDTPRASLTCRDGQMICRSDDGSPERRLPLEDVASVIITSFSATLHSHLLLKAAQHGVSFLFCENFKPASILLPANRCTDTLLTRAVIGMDPKTRHALWQKTIDAKVKNQLTLARHLAPTDKRLVELERMASGKNPAREAACAKYYWAILSTALGPDRFTRERHGGGLNHLLNYGYAVLLSCVLQKLTALGLDPVFGINHVVRERSAALAYDLMEPFRPCVDARVMSWVQRFPQGDLPEGAASAFDVSKEYRAWVTSFTVERVGHLDLELDVRGVIEGVCRSFRRAVMAKRSGIYKPWTPNDSKWAGSLSPSTSPC